MAKTYHYSSTYQLPYPRIPSFETKIEYPLPSENLALQHLRSANPTGFWNHGILGALIKKFSENLPDLPSSPIQVTSDKIIKQTPEFNSDCESLHVVISFFEGLDSSEEFYRIIDETLNKLSLTKLHLSFEFIPLLDEHRNLASPGIDELCVKLAQKYAVSIFNHHHLIRKTFSTRNHFLHVHNKIFYYYSVYEVIAKMNGASILYLHAINDLACSPEEVSTFKSILSQKSLRLVDLQLMHRYFLKMKFGVR